MAGFEDNQMFRDFGAIKYPPRNEPARLLRPSKLDVQPVFWEKTSEDETVDEKNEAIVRQYVEWAVTIATVITENLLSHPFLVLRRQCQVQPNSTRRHLIPVTLIPVVVRLHQRQGVTTLWKGLGSCLLVRGMTLAAEDVLSKFTPWPKEMPESIFNKTFGQHILLKCISLAVVTPFYSASFVETVQSDIASEKPGLFDVLKEGLCRVISWGSPSRGRMLPVWALIGPNVTHGLFKYFIASAVTGAAERTILLQKRAEQSRRGAINRDSMNEENIQDVHVTASFIGMVTAEVICYPLETILHRLHLQGTRTIVDNLDSGSQVVPILTGYEGAFDCYAETISQEGFSGLYKGFGALILQFAVHWAVIRLTRSVASQCACYFRSQKKSAPRIPRDTYQAMTPSERKAVTPSPNKRDWDGLYPIDTSASLPNMLEELEGDLLLTRSSGLFSEVRET